MKTTNILVFDGQTELLLTQLSNKDNDQCPFFSPEVLEQLNRDFTFDFSVPADHEDSQHLVEGNLVGLFDLDGELQVFQIYKTEESHTGTEMRKSVFTEHLFYEMKDDIVKDLRVVDGEAIEAMTKALSESRWEVGEVDSFGLGTVNFYYSDGVQNIVKTANVYGGELKFRFILDKNQFTQRLVDLKTRRGADTGNRFEFTKDLKEVKRTVESDGLKTALYGRGKGEQLDTGGYSRKPTFKDIVWRTIDGDPVDKPLGQEWVGLPEALEKFGRVNGTRHKFGTFDVDSTDPLEILQKTYEQLLIVSTPKVTYELSVISLERLSGYDHKKVRLGDTVFVIDRDLGLTIEARVLEIKYDPTNPENMTIVLGNFIDDITDYNAKIEEVEAKLKDREGVWDKVEDIEVGVIDDGSLIDIAPSVPTNVSAVGLFKSILLKWTYDPSIAISAYEVYGSRVQGFTPDSSNLLFRGKTGGFTHNADTNQTWYFRVRAMNPHGKVSAFTQEFSASTLQLQQPDFENLTVYDAMIHSVSADKLTAGEIDANDVNIVNLNVDNVIAGRLKAQFVEIGTKTVYENGYDPSEKATQQDIVDYTKPVMKEVYDSNFQHGKEYWSDTYVGDDLPPTNTGTVVTTSDGKVLKLTGTKRLYSRNAIPVNPNRVYRMTFQVRQTVDSTTSGTSNVYAGVVTLDENLQNISGGAGLHRYFSAQAEEIVVEDNWQTFTGLITGIGDDKDQFRDGTVFVRPMFIVNHNEGDGTVEVREIVFEDVTEIQNLEQRVSSVELLVEEDSIVSTVTNSYTYQEDLNSKANQQYVDDNFTTQDQVATLEQNINDQLEAKADLTHVDLTYATKSEVEQTAHELDFKFTSSGGVNLLRNSVGFSETDFWDVVLDEDGTGLVIGSIDSIQNAELREYGAGSAFELKGATIRQEVNTSSQFYTISMKVKKYSSGHGHLKIIYDDREDIISFNEGTTYDYEMFHKIIEPVGSSIIIEIYGTGGLIVTSTMVNVGNVPLQWQHSAGEIYNTNVLMDMNGIRVMNSDYKGYTAITPEEFSGYAEVENLDTGEYEMERVFTLNRDTTEVSKLEARKEIRMSPIKIIPVNDSSYKGWAFIPED